MNPYLLRFILEAPPVLRQVLEHFTVRSQLALDFSFPAQIRYPVRTTEYRPTTAEELPANWDYRFRPTEAETSLLSE